MTVFLLDVDNTLFDMTTFRLRLDEAFVTAVGRESADRLWQFYDQVRHDRGHVDLLEAIARLGREIGESRAEPIAAALDSLPYEASVFPGAMTTIADLPGLPVIVSDGDSVFQRQKIERSGLAAVVAGRIMVVEHKEDHIDDVVAAWPAEHYVVVDDKARLLGKFKRALGDRATTVHVQHGGYAADPPDAGDPPPDERIGAIDELVAVVERRLPNRQTSVLAHTSSSKLGDETAR